MEFHLHINQVRAREWDLSLAESMLFGYLITAAGWMTPHPKDGSYKWASNSKLLEELPLLFEHEGSARRLMAKLEGKGLIERIVWANKSYFRVTNLGLTWRSNTVEQSPEPEESPDEIGDGDLQDSAETRANHLVCPDQESTDRANQTVRPGQTDRFVRANQMVRRSYKPDHINQDQSHERADAGARASPPRPEPLPDRQHEDLEKRLLAIGRAVQGVGCSPAIVATPEARGIFLAWLDAAITRGEMDSMVEEARQAPLEDVGSNLEHVVVWMHTWFCESRLKADPGDPPAPLADHPDDDEVAA